MHEDNEETQIEQQPEVTRDITQEAPPPATAAPVTPPAAAPPAPSTSAAKRVISMPSDEVARIRRDERRKGAQARELELAKELGFDTIDAMKEAVRATKGKKPAAPAPAARGPKAVPATKVEKERAEWEAEKKALLRRSSLAQRTATIARRERDNALVESELRVAAVRVGVVDQDYAIHLLRKQMKGKTAKELESFDEIKYFTGLRETHPHLFMVETRPITTGNGQATNDGASAKPAPKPGAQTQADVDGKTVDAKNLSREEYEKRLANLGVANPSVGYSY